MKNLIRIYNTNIYHNYPNPRIYSHNDDNKKVKYTSIRINNIIIHNQKDGYCMYNKNLCTPYKIDIKISNRNGYLFFFKKTWFFIIIINFIKYIKCCNHIKSRTVSSVYKTNKIREKIKESS